jgi:HAE1 family hydrophobic/amphiphilic exporter-1
MKISEYSVKRPVTVLMATLSVLVLGYISLSRLPLTLLPELTSENLRVSVDYPSSSPEEIQRNITRPLEEYLSTLDGLEKLESTSSSTGSSIRLEFKQGMDMDLVALEVRDRIDQVRNDLPEDVERVSIRRWQTTDMPVFRFAVGWAGDREEFFRITEDILRRRLERIDGVANVDIAGIDAKQVIIDLNDRLLQTHGIDVFNLAQALRNNNVSLTGGYVIDGNKKYTLRTVGELLELDEIRNLPLQGGRLTIADVATVRYDFPERDSFARLNGEEAVRIAVYKASTANVVEVCRGIQQELESIQTVPALKDKLMVQIFDDQSESILSALNDLKTAGIYGGALAIIVLFLFLMKFRSTLIISLAIPVSIVFTCAFMFLLRVLAGSDISLNIVSLMGLMVAVGMLVDNSVVVLENIFRYKQDKGYSAFEAAIKGSGEVSVAVLASTATTVAVFASFIFLPNAVTGRFTRDFGITVAVSLIASLIVALTLVPMVSARIFTGKERPKQRIMVWVTETYGRAMRIILRFRFVALILMAGLGFFSYVLFQSINREFMPNVAERQIRFEVLMERSFSVEEMQGLFDQIEGILLDRKEEYEIKSISSRFDNRTTRRGQYRGNLELFLKEEGVQTPTMTLRGQIQEGLPKVPGVEYKPGRMRHFGGGSEMGISVELKGDDPAILGLYADEVKNRIASVPGALDVQTTLESGDDEIHLSVDREKLEKYQLSSMTVARVISSSLSTRATTRIKGDTGEIDVILQLKGANRVSLPELLNMNLENRSGEMIPLHSVVTFDYQKGPMAIRREDRKAIINVTADTEGASFFITQEVEGLLSSLPLPSGYTWAMGRNWRRARESEQENMFSILLALILMYIIMAALFENFVHPLTILFTVPFSIIGVAGVFYLTNTSLSNMAFLGILVLFGIVVNNGIILIDHINTLRRDGMSRNEAIVQGGMDRHRPIVMTACTSLFGLLPLTLPSILPQYFPSSGGRAGWWAPVSLAVLGGLTTSTFLTLVILPAVYTYMDDLSRAVVWTAKRVASPIRTASQVLAKFGAPERSELPK